MRVLVCGGRDYRDGPALFKALDAVGPDSVVHGAYRGADELAEKWAKMRAVVYIGVPAKWGAVGGRAGPERNQRMLDLFSPDLVLAFPGGAGTADMVARAKAAGIEVREAP